MLHQCAFLIIGQILYLYMLCWAKLYKFGIIACILNSRKSQNPFHKVEELFYRYSCHCFAVFLLMFKIYVWFIFCAIKLFVLMFYFLGRLPASTNIFDGVESSSL